MKSRSAGPTRAAVARWRLLEADLALGREVADQVVGVAGDEVPGACDPLAAELPAPELGGQLLEPGVDAVGLQRRRPARARPGRRRAGRRRGPARAARSSGGSKPAGRDPAAVGHQDRPPRQPVAVVDRGVRVARLLDGRQVGPDHRPPAVRARPDAEGPGDLARPACWRPAAGRTPGGSGSAAPARRRRCLRPGRDASIPPFRVLIRVAKTPENSRSGCLETSVATGCRHDATGRWTSITRGTFSLPMPGPVDSRGHFGRPRRPEKPKQTSAREGFPRRLLPRRPLRKLSALWPPSPEKVP